MAVCSRICFTRIVSSSEPISRWAPSGAHPASVRNARRSVVVGPQPVAYADEAVRPQGVDAGVQQPGAVTAAPGGRIDDQLVDRSVRAGVGVGVLTGQGGGQTHHLPLGDRHQDPPAGLGWPGDGAVPGRRPWCPGRCSPAGLGSPSSAVSPHAASLDGRRCPATRRAAPAAPSPRGGRRRRAGMIRGHGTRSYLRQNVIQVTPPGLGGPRVHPA